MSPLIPFALAILALYVLFLKTRHPKGFPPHPGFSLPMVGDMLSLLPNTGEAFKRMRAKYGDVYGFLMGTQRQVGF